MSTTSISLRPENKEFVAENIGLITLFILSLIALPVVYTIQSDTISMVIGLLSLVLALILIVKYISLTAVVWIVNNDTICRIQGFFSRSTDYIELYRVVDYRETQNFLQKIMNVKTVTIVSTDKSDALMDIYGINYNIDLVGVIRERVEKCKKEKRIYEITNQ